ncbi:type VI secretion system TssO [Prevotella fusca]
MTKDEKIWSTIKFTLLLTFSVALLYILLCKYVMPIPVSITGNAVAEINEAETIFKDQKQMAEKMIVLRQDIDSLNFEIQQSQRISEIKDRMAQLQNNYRQHSYNVKYLYCMQSFKTIQDYFDIKQKLYWTSKTKEDRKHMLEMLKGQLR